MPIPDQCLCAVTVRIGKKKCNKKLRKSKLLLLCILVMSGVRPLFG